MAALALTVTLLPGHVDGQRLQFNPVADGEGQHLREIALQVQGVRQARRSGGQRGIGRHGVIDGVAVQRGRKNIASGGRQIGHRLKKSAVHKQIRLRQRQVGGGSGEGQAQIGLPAQHGAVGQRTPVGAAGTGERGRERFAHQQVPQTDSARFGNRPRPAKNRASDKNNPPGREISACNCRVPPPCRNCRKRRPPKTPATASARCFPKYNRQTKSGCRPRRRAQTHSCASEKSASPVMQAEQIGERGGIGVNAAHGIIARHLVFKNGVVKFHKPDVAGGVGGFGEINRLGGKRTVRRHAAARECFRRRRDWCP